MINIANLQSIASKFTCLPFHVFAKNKDGYYLFCNHVMAQDLGLLNTREIIGKSDKDLVWKDFANSLREHDQYVMAKENDYDFIESVKFSSKQDISLLSYKYPLVNTIDDVIEGVFGVSFVRNFTNKLNRLSGQQKQCIDLTIQGFSAKEIAKILQISHRTVEEYLEKAKIRFNCRNKSQLIAEYVKEILLLSKRCSAEHDVI